MWHPSIVELHFVVLLHGAPKCTEWQQFFSAVLGIPYSTVETGVVWSPHNVGLVYNYRNSLSENFTGDAKNVLKHRK